MREIAYELWVFIVIGALWCVVQYLLFALAEAVFGQLVKRGICQCFMCRTTDGFMRLMETNLTARRHHA